MAELGAVVFDFDGTLVDSEWPIYERSRLGAATLGLDLTPELWAAHAVGVSHGESYWAPLASALGTEIDEVTFDRARLAVDGPSALHDSELVHGASELIHALVAAGVRLAVASGSERAWLTHHLERFGLIDCFEALVGRDHPEVRGGKPLPDLYAVAMATLAVEPSTVVAIEDTVRGIDSARAAGVGAVVAVPSRLTSHQDLTGAHLVAESLPDLDPDRLAGLLD